MKALRYFVANAALAVATALFCPAARAVVPELFALPAAPGAKHAGALGTTHGLFLLTVLDSTGLSLWKTNGTHSGTAKVKRISQFSSLNGTNVVANVDGAIYFDPDGASIFRTDGTALHTRAIFTGAAVPNFRFLDDEVLVGTRLFITVSTTEATELWTVGINGGPATKLKAFPNADYAVNVGGLSPKNGAVLFTALKQSPLQGELWSSDGSVGGTQLVTSLPNHSLSAPTPAGSVHYFSAALNAPAASRTYQLADGWHARRHDPGVGSRNRSLGDGRWSARRRQWRPG
jgi:hypothetical protein